MKLSDAKKLINPSVSKLAAYHLTPVDTDIKLNQNENPFDWPEDIKRECADFLKKRPWNRYPEFIPEDLKDLLGGFVGLSGENIIAGNGSNEMLLTLMLSFAGLGKKVLISEPTFSVYKLLGEGYGSELIFIPLKDDLSYDQTAMVNLSKKNNDAFMIICSPNNPTGQSISKNDLLELLQIHNGIILLDQAYVEFGGYNALELLDSYPNLIITRTFSKAQGAAGIRIGYMVGNKELISEINKIKLPYNIDFITEHIAKQILKAQDHTDKTVKIICKERSRVLDFFKTQPFEKVYDTDANFFLVKTEKKDELFEFLKSRSILIRDVSSYPMLKNHLRLNIGTNEENKILTEVIKEFWSKNVK